MHSGGTAQSTPVEMVIHLGIHAITVIRSIDSFSRFPLAIFCLPLFIPYVPARLEADSVSAVLIYSEVAGGPFDPLYFYISRTSDFAADIELSHRYVVPGVHIAVTAGDAYGFRALYHIFISVKELDDKVVEIPGGKRDVELRIDLIPHLKGQPDFQG